jgi:hypothetical protein
MVPHTMKIRFHQQASQLPRFYGTKSNTAKAVSTFKPRIIEGAVAFPNIEHVDRD